jgi:hypothetical protein
MRLPMQTEFRGIVQSEYGVPEKVLRIAKRPLKSEDLPAQGSIEFELDTRAIKSSSLDRNPRWNLPRPTIGVSQKDMLLGLGFGLI